MPAKVNVAGGAFAEAGEVLEAVVRASPLPIMIFAPDGTTIGWNPAAEATFGFTAAEVVGRLPPSVPPDKLDEFRANLADVLSGAGPQGVEIERVRKDGTRIRLSAWTAPLRDATGRPVGVVSILADLTEQQRTAALLQDEQARVGLAFAAARLGAWSLDLVTREVWWSDAQAELWGLERGGLMPLEDVFAWMHPDDRERSVVALDRARADGERYETEFRVIWPDGSVHWLSSQAVVVADESGRPVRLLGVAADADARHEAEERLRRLVDANIVGIALTTEAGFVEANDEFLRVLGLTREQFAAGSVGWAEMTPPEHHGASVAALGELLEAGRVAPFEKDYVRPDGTRARVLIGGVLLDRDPPRWMTVVLDQTERFELLERERDARTAAERVAARMARLQALAAALAAARTTAEVAQATAEQAMAAFGARRGQVALLRGDRSVEVVGLTGKALPDDWRALGLDEPLPVPHAVREGIPVCLTGAADRAREFPALAERGSVGGALAAIPLLLGDEAIGALTISFDDERAFPPEDVEVLLTLGRQCAQAFERVRLDEAERAARERAAFLADASALLGTTLDHAQTLDQVGRLAVPRLADLYYVLLADGEGGFAVVASAHARPELREVAESLAEVLPPGSDPSSGVGLVVRTGEPLLVANVDDVLLDSSGRPPEQVEALKRLGLRSLMIVPLTAHGRALGAMSLISTSDERRYGPDDLALAADIGRRAAVAVENALLHESESRARELAEANAARLASLQTVAVLLAGAATTADVIGVLLREGIAASGARAAVVCLPTPAGDELEVVASEGYGAEIFERWRRFPLDAPTPMSEAVRTGQPLFISSTADRDRRYPALQGSNPDSHSMVALPLVGSSGPFGGIALGFPVDRSFTVEEREHLETLARLCAQALERARLYEEREQRATASFVLEHVADGVFQLDEDGRIGFWNPAAEEITGVAAADALGRQVTDVLRGWRGAETASLAVPVEVEGRELWLSVSGVEVEGRHVFAFRDLTQERSLEYARREFLATASHELRTPLTAVYGAAQTLLERTLTDERRAQMTRVVVAESERLARIVDDLLLANRLDLGNVALELDRCDAGEIVREVVEIARATAPAAIEFEVEAGDGDAAVNCDRDRLRQVVANLVENAVKYSPEGGRVLARVVPLGERVRIVVEDEGLGIPQGERDRVFEKFFRLDPDLRRGIGGTGLGLYISRELVERMNGRIWVEPRDRGTRFVVSLPAA
jgi:PAS domain S-box-containing protein